MRITDHFLGIIYLDDVSSDEKENRKVAFDFAKSERPEFRITKFRKVRNKHEYRFYGHRKEYE